MQAILPISLLPDLTFNLIWVEEGVFLMGDKESEYEDEKPAHRVSISSFYIGQCQVTQALWKAVMDVENPSGFKGDNHPVESVSWDKVQVFIQKLNKVTRKQFRLPTEAEWEYAARGGRYSQGYEYAGSDKLKQVGWYDENSGYETHEVGLLLANELGIHDLSGNVWEWCEDDWHNNYKGAPDDGSAWIDAPERGVYRVVRGGGYFNNAVDCRPANRDRNTPVNRNDDLGFRLVLPLQSVG